MPYLQTTATNKIASLTKKIRIVQGGTSASKTISILLYLIAMAQTDKKKTLTSIVAESTPHLKRGALRDFKNIMMEHNYWKDNLWNATDSIYTFETGSQIEFFSADQPDKLRGARRDRCFMNEANNMELDTFDQLEVRTKEFIILDFNPTNEFWVYTEILPNRTDAELIILTYKDNEALSKEIVDSIEQRKNRKQWWKVYGEGQLGEVEGRVYTGWIQIDEIPPEARLERRGLDYGYSNDPTAIVDIYKWNGAYIFDEIIYQKGLSNKQIADILLSQDNPKILVVPDSAEPKSNDELVMYGVPVLPATKGKGSVNFGIQILQSQKIFVTKRSRNIWREYNNYLWETDKNGVMLNVPQGGFDHACFTKDTKIETLSGNIVKTVFTGKRDVYEFMGSKVTADHPYLTQRGFVRLDSIRYSDTIVVWKNKLLTELHLDDIHSQTGVRLKTIFHLLKKNLSAIKLNVFTGTYGKNTTVKYLKAFIYTIKTVTHLIMIYLISNVYHLNSTAHYIIKKTCQSGEEIWILLESTPYIGTQQKRVLHFIKRLVLCPIKMTQRLYKNVLFAIKNIKYGKRNLKKENTATIIAKLKHLGQEDVYATSTTNGVFLANGVLVSNCDAIRYGMETLNIDTSISKIDEYMRMQARRNSGINFAK